MQQLCWAEKPFAALIYWAEQWEGLPTAPASWWLFLEVVQEDGSACWGLGSACHPWSDVKLSWHREGIVVLGWSHC